MTARVSAVCHASGNDPINAAPARVRDEVTDVLREIAAHIRSATATHP